MAGSETSNGTAAGTTTGTTTEVTAAGSTPGSASAETSAIAKSATTPWRMEVIVGGAMVAIVVVVALVFRWRPDQIFIDRWGFSLIHPDVGNSFWVNVTDIRSSSTLVAGSILAALVVVLRDYWRALACLVAPTVAVVLAEYVLKPWIARRYAEVLTFPSGSVTAVAAVAAAWVLAVPLRLRFLVVVIGAFVIGLECVAVVALQWHYPTDALGGALFGVGFVLLADGLLHMCVVAVRSRHSGSPTDEPEDTANGGSPVQNATA